VAAPCCLQDPWIQNTTVRNNVLLGKAYDEDAYMAILAACALAPDLEMLPAGDATEIGEKGGCCAWGSRVGIDSRQSRVGFRVFITQNRKPEKRKSPAPTG
jgi:hypothetical protein